MAKSGKNKWALLQARIDVESMRALRDLAKKEGLPSSAYVRRLVMQHLDLKKSEAATA